MITTAANSAPKSTLRLSVTIDWAGLPVTKTGFKGYYQGYVIDADGMTIAASNWRAPSSGVITPSITS